LRIALDATYSLGRNLSGVGVYSREILFGLARAHQDQRFHFCYRPHRLWKSLADSLPPNASRRLLGGAPPRADLFHALNQRVDVRARRTVATFHDLFALTGEYSSPEFRTRFAEQARRAAERSDAIIAVSQFTASQVEQFLGVESARIHVIPLGVRIPAPLAQALLPAQAFVPRERGTGDRRTVLFVGAIQRRKNIARLVKAFERMPAGWRLTLAGATDGYAAAAELRAVEESPRRADIDVPGYVSSADLALLYSRASIFSFPSLEEGFGIPVLEAMAHGVPVITSQSDSALPETAGDAAILVDPTDIDQLAAELNRLATDEDLRADLIRRGLDRARLFPWEAAIEKTWDVYGALLAGAR
jgi:glycosyltransferase involved in cell wall biosynthesis